MTICGITESNALLKGVETASTYILNRLIIIQLIFPTNVVGVYREGKTWVRFFYLTQIGGRTSYILSTFSLRLA